MLKSVDPLLSPELLFVLASMGHGDDVVLADANFPAAATAKLTAYGSVVWLPGVDLPTASPARMAT